MFNNRRNGSNNSALTTGILTTVGVGVAAISYVPGLSGWVFAQGGETGSTCIVQRLLGWRCPFCGMTHGTVDLLHGHVGSAIRHNVFTPVFVLGLAVLIAGAYIVPVAQRVAAVTTRIGQARLGFGLLSALLVYTALRNIVGGAT